jgi:hypothetical protein
MRKSIQERHKRVLSRMFLVDTVTISAPLPDGSWTTPVEVKASVQQPRGDRSSPDRQEASEREARTVVVYVPGETVVDTGCRVVWNDGWEDRSYTVESAASERTNRAFLRLDVARAQTAVPPVNVTFRRRNQGAWIEVGTYPVSMMISPNIQQSAPGIVGGVSSAQTAAGAVTVGVFTGDSRLLALDVGDWFTWQGVPGRITAMDRDDLDSIECAFELEALVP